MSWNEKLLKLKLKIIVKMGKLNYLKKYAEMCLLFVKNYVKIKCE